MKLSFSTLGCPGWGLDEVIAACKKYGYTGVELRGLRDSRELTGMEEFSPENIAGTAKKFKDNGIDVVCVSTGIKFFDSTQAAQEERMKTARRYFEICKGLGCGYMRVFGGVVDKDVDFDEHAKAAHGQVGEISLAGGDYGVTTLVETHDSFCRSVDVIKLVEGNRNIGIVWDILHPYRWGEDMQTTYNNLKGYIKHIHLKDSLQYSKDGFDITLPGKGTIPIKTAVDILRDNHFDGYFSFEWEKAWHPEIEAADIALPAYTAYLNKLI